MTAPSLITTAHVPPTWQRLWLQSCGLDARSPSVLNARSSFQFQSSIPRWVRDAPAKETVHGPLGAGAGAMATGLVQAAWVLAAIRTRCPNDHLYLEWAAFANDRRGLLVWEAFVTGESKGASHVDDATIAVNAFSAALPDPTTASTVAAERPLSLAAAVALWSGWLESAELLHCAPLVIRA